MELILNLFWLMLALPAYWLWRRVGSAQAAARFSSRSCLLALGCILILLFPVVSATDDLHAMRPEIEESSPSKRSLRQVSSDRGSRWVHDSSAPPLAVIAAAFLLPPEVCFTLIPARATPSALSAPPSTCSTRAPPFSTLG